jgi:hypothetical protein
MAEKVEQALLQLREELDREAADSDPNIGGSVIVGMERSSRNTVQVSGPNSLPPVASTSW